MLKYGASLPQANTVLQGWEGVTDAGGNLISSQVIEAVHMGYRAIDAVYVNSYLDCGTGNWLTGGRSWCDPFKSWNMVYMSEPTTREYVVAMVIHASERGPNKCAAPATICTHAHTHTGSRATQQSGPGRRRRGGSMD